MGLVLSRISERYYSITPITRRRSESNGRNNGKEPGAGGRALAARLIRLDGSRKQTPHGDGGPESGPEELDHATHSGTWRISGAVSDIHLGT